MLLLDARARGARTAIEPSRGSGRNEENEEMNNRLYVGNLAFHTTEDVLLRAFQACGEVVEAKLILDR